MVFQKLIIDYLLICTGCLHKKKQQKTSETLFIDLKGEIGNGECVIETPNRPNSKKQPKSPMGLQYSLVLK